MSLDLLNFTLAQFQLYILVSIRLSAMMLTAPFFGNQAFPVEVKIGFALLVSLILFPLIQTAGTAIPQHLGAFLVVVFLELSVGILIGFAASFIFAGVQLGGHLVSQEIGITIADVIDPISNNNISVISQYQALFAALIFMLLGGPNLLIVALFQSYTAVPVAGLVMRPEWVEQFTGAYSANMWSLAVKTGAPISVALLVATVAMGFMARSVPEMNIFILGFTIRLIMGLLILLVTIDMVTYIFQVYMEGMFRDMNGLLSAMRG